VEIEKVGEVVVVGSQKDQEIFEDKEAEWVGDDR